MHTHGRRIESVNDVEAAVTGRCSVPELLECVAIASRAQRWDLVGTAGELALVHHIGVSPKDVESLATAARAVLAACLANAHDLEQLPSALNLSDYRLRHVQAQLRDAPEASRAATEIALEDVRELRVLLAGRDSATYVSLCSVLRRVDRPDLGILAATRALDLEPENHAALTTRGAALLDEGMISDAVVDLRAAWNAKESAHTAAALTRALAAAERTTQALDLAELAFRRFNSHECAATLIKVAVQAQDERLYNEALAFLNESSSRPKSKGWLALLSVESLIDAGRLDEAEVELAKVAQMKSVPQLKLRNLTGKLANRRLRQLRQAS